MNVSALIAILVLAGALFFIFGTLYAGALRSHARGEIGMDGIRILRWALLGYVTLYVILGITVFLV